MGRFFFLTSLRSRVDDCNSTSEKRDLPSDTYNISHAKGVEKDSSLTQLMQLMGGQNF